MNKTAVGVPGPVLHEVPPAPPAAPPEPRAGWLRDAEAQGYPGGVPRRTSVRTSLLVATAPVVLMAVLLIAVGIPRAHDLSGGAGSDAGTLTIEDRTGTTTSATAPGEAIVVYGIVSLVLMAVGTLARAAGVDHVEEHLETQEALAGAQEQLAVACEEEADETAAAYLGLRTDNDALGERVHADIASVRDYFWADYHRRAEQRPDLRGTWLAAGEQRERATWIFDEIFGEISGVPSAAEIGQRMEEARSRSETARREIDELLGGEART